MAVAAGLAVLIQLTLGYLTALPAATVALSVFSLLVLFFAEAFITVYGINCMSVGDLPTNNCGVYSKFQAITVAFIFGLVIIVSSMSLFSLWFYGEKALDEDEEVRKLTQKSETTAVDADVAPTRLVPQSGMDSRLA